MRRYVGVFLPSANKICAWVYTKTDIIEGKGGGSVYIVNCIHMRRKELEKEQAQQNQKPQRKKQKDRGWER